MNDLFTEKQIFKVSEITRDIRTILEDSFSGVWIEGEISGLQIPQSGHMYFTLKDSKAQLRCVFFKRANSNLDFTLEDGLACVLFGRVSVYDARGQYQLIVEKAEPKGKGALQLKFEQLKKKLAEEGLFEQARKRPIPFLPQKIGVVTSPTGAAIRDILNIIERRYANVHVIIRPALVQGKTAAADIAQGIKDLNKYKDLDVLIVGRGGGSLEDLWPFNEEAVARAVYESKIPVISAVGHEIDFTICDFTADLRAPTPSAAAELVVREKAQLAARLADMQHRMGQTISEKLKFLNLRLMRIAQSHALRRPGVILEQYQQRLDALDKSLLVNFKRIIEQYQQRFMSVNKTLSLNFMHLVKTKESMMKQMSSRLVNLNPLAILGRGYSVTYAGSSKKALKNIKDVKKTDILKTKLNNGVIISRVEDCIS
ncbi:MAG: exodeoxyribonuclease VII large subunit [PVC group bacterium]|nr:exodeoxyribonuclease VII large subunit [PVC group bacterium]